MSTHPGDSTGASWLTPRDTYLRLALTGPSPAEVHRDLPDILRANAMYAYPWQPVQWRPGQDAVDLAVDLNADLTAANPDVGPAPVNPPPRPAPKSRGSWFQRGPLRPRAQF
ncbi:MAG TPA: hypothetical protein VMU51_04910 [Mycobacteriales bacterium]|nr:hypothetical protein [Mycobacteriales bacterium]